MEENEIQQVKTKNFAWPVIKYTVIGLLLGVLYFIVCPFLISAYSTEYVILGFILGLIPIIFGVIKLINFIAKKCCS